jgi:hypothetical protein
VKLNRASDLGPYLLQEQHRRAARDLRENTVDPVYTPHLVCSVPQSNRNAEVPCEDTSPLSRQASQPDLIRSLLPGSEAGLSNAVGLDPAAPGDQLYRFAALEIKELSHRLDGVLWPRETTGCAETGSPEFPVVLLEAQIWQCR